MNKYLNGVLVVEGKSDICLLSNFIHSPIVKTNGFELNQNLVKFLQLIQQKTKIYIFTDFDESGAKISEKLCKNLKNFENLRFKSTMFTSKNKHGIAESNRDELIKYLEPYLIDENWYKETHSLADFLSLNKDEQNHLIETYFLQDSTTKNIVKKWNMISSLGLEK